MKYEIRMGVPEMKAFWDALRAKTETGRATKDEERLYRRLGKTLFHLSGNPRHPGLCSHEIAALTARYGMKVWELYLENRTAAAGRIFWVYGPERSTITVIGIEPHPDDTSHSYKKITLSAMGE